jgi:formylglycine-generating enzyme required for sulfatase activity
VPRALDAICRKAMAPRPEDRYASAAALADDLERFLADEPVQARRESLPERLTRGARRHRVWVQASCLILFLLFVGIGVAVFAFRQQRHAVHLRGLVQSVRTADLESLARLAPELKPVGSELESLLREAAREPQLSERERLNIMLALAQQDAVELDWLVEKLLGAPPRDLLRMCELLQPRRAELVRTLWQRVEDGHLDANSLLPVACVLAQYAPSDPRWPTLREKVAQALVRQNPLVAAQWLPGFRPAAGHLVSPLADLCANERDEPAMSNAAQLLADYGATKTDLIAARLLDAEPAQLQPLITALRAHPREATGLLYTALRETNLPPIPAAFAKDPDSHDPQAPLIVLRARQGRAAVALLAMGEKDVWQFLDVSPDPTVRVWVAELAARAGVPVEIWLAAWQRETDVGRRRLILQALARYAPSQVPAGDREWLLTDLKEHFVSEADPGLHAAIGWVLRRWGYQQQVAALESELASADPLPGRNWYVNRQGQTFTVIDGPRDGLIGARHNEWGVQPAEFVARRRLDRTVAVCQTEVTVDQLVRLLGSHTTQNTHFSIEQDCPAVAVKWLDAARYCRLLSEQEGIADDQMCFPPVSEIRNGMTLPADYLERTGYRLPTEVEWEFAARADTLTRGHFGVDMRLTSTVGWHLVNSRGVSRPVASLHPNEWGLFDTLGNVWEWTVGLMGNNEMASNERGVVADDLQNRQIGVGRTLRGHDFSQGPGFLRSASKVLGQGPDDAPTPNIGFRVVRTLPRPASEWCVVSDGSAPSGTAGFRVHGTGIPVEIRNVSGTDGLEVTPRRFWTPATVHIRAADKRFRPFVVQAVRLDKQEAVELRGVAGQIVWDRAFHVIRGSTTDNTATPPDWEKLRSSKPLASNRDFLYRHLRLPRGTARLPHDSLAMMSKTEIEVPAGFYEFFLRADCAAALRIDGMTLLNAPAPNYPSTMPVNSWLEFPTGKHRLEVDYLHREGSTDLRFDMRRIDSVGPIRNVPASVPHRLQDEPLAIYLEGEEMRILGTCSPPPAVSRPNMLPYGRYWSGGRHLWVEATEAGQWLDFSFSVPRGGTYELICTF